MAELQRYQMYINGEWVDAENGKTFTSVNPATGETWAEVPEAESKDENPHEQLHGLARVYQKIDGDARERVRRIVKESGALPVARDTRAFAAVLQMLNDGASQRQLEYVRGSPGARSPLAPAVPRGPCGPVSPGSPGSPCGPCGPCGPGPV